MSHLQDIDWNYIVIYYIVDISATFNFDYGLLNLILATNYFKLDGFKLNT